MEAENSRGVLLSVLLVVGSLWYLVRHIIYPAFFSALAKVPNAHPLAPFTSLWITWVRYRDVENRTLEKAHKQHGEVVRLGPSELSVNCVNDGIKTIYGKGFDKIPFYTFFMNFGFSNMFSSLPSRDHAKKKKRISNIYSKSYLRTSADARAITAEVLYKRLLPRLAKSSATKTPVSIFTLFQATAMDLTTAYFFGLPVSTNHIEQESVRAEWLEQYLASRPKEFVFFLQEIPQLNAWFERIGFSIVPKDRLFINDKVDAWILKMCDGAEELLASREKEDRIPGHWPLVYEQLKKKTAEEGLPGDNSIRLEAAVARQRQKDPEAEKVLAASRSMQQLEIASELMDQLVANHETFSITFLYIAHELSKHPEIQEQLRCALRELDTPITFPSETNELPTPQALDDVPLLNAVINETLRLHPPLAGAQPRITPPGAPTKLGSYANIPPNTRVSSCAWVMHRNPEVYPDPERWHPERWLERGPAFDGDIDEKDRWFWAFSSGARMCIGSNYAMQMMKFVIAAIYTNFRTSVVDDEGIEQGDGFVAGPVGGKFMFSFDAVVE